MKVEGSSFDIRLGSDFGEYGSFKTEAEPKTGAGDESSSRENFPYLILSPKTSGGWISVLSTLNSRLSFSMMDESGDEKSLSSLIEETPRPRR